jgi:hypothetical protein
MYVVNESLVYKGWLIINSRLNGKYNRPKKSAQFIIKDFSLSKLLFISFCLSSWLKAF